MVKVDEVDELGVMERVAQELESRGLNAYVQKHGRRDDVRHRGGAGGPTRTLDRVGDSRGHLGRRGPRWRGGVRGECLTSSALFL
jgi:hypothetical protein